MVAVLVAGVIAGIASRLVARWLPAEHGRGPPVLDPVPGESGPDLSAGRG